MAGISASELIVYPKELTDANWQKKKGLMAKRVSTGLGAELKKGEALHKKIVTDKLEADSNAPKTVKDLQDGIDAAKKHYRDAVQPLIDHMKVIKKAADDAEAALLKKDYKDAAKVAKEIGNDALLFGVKCKSVDLEASITRGKERLNKLNMLAANLLNASIKKFLVSTKVFLASDGNAASWEDNVKQNGRSVSNSVRQLENYHDAFWAEFQKFQGFDLVTMGLSGDEEKTKQERLKVCREAVKQVADIARFKG